MPLIITDIDRAILDLQQGVPVAIPTETVYGLAAPINNQDAIKAVYAMKDRPVSHPLIVHVAEHWDLSTLVDEIPEYAQTLINAFWPGPLTLVFSCKNGQVTPLVTAGQATVAIRSPAHPMAQKLLTKLNIPLVAPSANPFGKISPTTAVHVKKSFPNQKNLLVLDGGRCAVGIESTIVDATCPESYQILRHGLIDEQAIEHVIATHYLKNKNNIRVPGNLESHYQPQKILYYFDDQRLLNHFCQKGAGDVFVIATEKPTSVPEDLFLPLGNCPEQAAYNLYFQLRQADESRAMCLAIELPPRRGQWIGIRERILKAGLAYSK
jgi:L-threonylcarbamoyladenylate synthase